MPHKILPWWGGFEVRTFELFKEFKVGNDFYRCGLKPDEYPFYAYAPVINGIPDFSQARFYVDKDGNLKATNADIEGKIVAGAGSEIDGAYIKDLTVTRAKIANLAVDELKLADNAVSTEKIQDEAVTNEKIKSLTADKITAGTIDASKINVININADNITAGTITGRTIRTSQSGQRVEMGGPDAPYPDELYFYNSSGYLLLEIFAGSDRAIIQGNFDVRPVSFEGYYGHQSLVVYETYLEVENIYPLYDDRDIGSPGSKFRNLYLSGNIYIDGEVDGVNISAHVSNPSAHHSKTRYISEITIDENVDFRTYDATNVGYLYFSSSYGRIYWGSDLEFDFYSYGIEVGNNLLPYASGAVDLGASYQYWGVVHCEDIVFYTPDVVAGGLDKLKTIKADKKGKINKKVVHKDLKEGENGLSTGKIIMALIDAVKELENRIKTLENKIL